MTVTDKEAYESRIDRVLISEEEIKQALKRCGEQISREYEGKPLLLVSVLKGAFVFLADLCREISIPCEIGFMAAQSYFEGTSSRGNVQITYDLAQDLSRYHVIIVEDIIDTGRTLAEIIKLINIRVVPLEADISLFTIPDHFVIGYGLDCGEYYRNLPYIAEYKEKSL